jgi:hypothetical protein
MTKINNLPQRFELGWGAPPISEQFEGFVPKEDLIHFDLDSEAISRLRLRGYLTDSAHQIVVKKFSKKLSGALLKGTADG